MSIAKVHWGWILGVVWLASPAAAEPPTAAMQQIFIAISELLPESLEEDGFAPSEQSERQRAALVRLAEGAEQLRIHAESRELDFQVRSDALQEDAERALLAFERGRGPEVSMALHRVTQECVGCHARLPDLADAPIGERWLEKANLSGLRDEERARLFVATRRFEDALGAWESLFRDPEVAPFEASISGELTAYLAVSIRVKRDLVRPQRTLRTLAERPDAPRFLVARLERWADDLSELERRRSSGESPLALADALRHEVHELDGLPYAREGLVRDLVAGAVLMTWLDDTPEDAVASERAAAWYRLAILDERIAEETALPRTEVYLEAALRADPGGALATASYEGIEELSLWDHGAPVVEALPTRERERMLELEALAFQDQEAAPVP